MNMQQGTTQGLTAWWWSFCPMAIWVESTQLTAFQSIWRIWQHHSRLCTFNILHRWFSWCYNAEPGVSNWNKTIPIRKRTFPKNASLAQSHLHIDSCHTIPVILRACTASIVFTQRPEGCELESHPGPKPRDWEIWKILFYTCATASH